MIDVTLGGLTERQIEAMMIGVQNVNRTLTDEKGDPLPDQLLTAADLVAWAIEFSLLPPLLDQLEQKELKELKAMWDVATEEGRAEAHRVLTEKIVLDTESIIVAPGTL